MKVFLLKVCLGCIVAASMSFTAGAVERSADDARSVADAFMADKVHAVSRSVSVEPKLIHTSLSDTDSPLFYVFNYEDAGRFVIVSGDDAVRPVLGYSDSGLFDPDNIPAPLKWWLREYVANMDAAVSHGLSQDVSAGTRRVAIEPLVQTKWNQTMPYNLRCPKLGVGSRDYAMTGCVATAMAQIANYYKWPREGGNGSWAYSTDKYSVSFDFAAARFDWDNMLPEVTMMSPKEQRDAVAELMYACGVSVDMIYSMGASGAASALVPDGFREYLGYDPMVRYVRRDYYSDAEWEDLIYNELSYGRPVQYSGYTSYSGGVYDGGHSFVCDGYDDNGLFHINWGWGGLSDGFYALSLLNPGEQGAGSSQGGYNYGQCAIIGIQPPVDGSKPFRTLWSEGCFKFDNVRTFTVTDYLTNESILENTYTLGIMVFNQSGNVVDIVQGEGTDLTLTGYIRGVGGTQYNNGQYVKGCTIKIPAGSLDDLDAGSYRIYPAYRTSEMDWTVMHTFTEPHYVVYDVQGTGGITETELEQFSVGVVDGMVRISGARDGECVNVYDIMGRVVASACFYGPEMSLSLPGSGIYIVRCGSDVTKIKY